MSMKTCCLPDAPFDESWLSFVAMYVSPRADFLVDLQTRLRVVLAVILTHLYGMGPHMPEGTLKKLLGK